MKKLCSLFLVFAMCLSMFPTTVIAIRNSLDSAEPSKIIFPVWIVTICAATAAVVMGKILIKCGK